MTVLRVHSQDPVPRGTVVNPPSSVSSSTLPDFTTWLRLRCSPARCHPFHVARLCCRGAVLMGVLSFLTATVSVASAMNFLSVFNCRARRVRTATGPVLMQVPLTWAIARMVPPRRFELLILKGNWFLRPACLPFHQRGLALEAGFEPAVIALTGRRLTVWPFQIGGPEGNRTLNLLLARQVHSRFATRPIKL